MNTLTCDQLAVLGWMDDRNIGAVLFEGTYRFANAFRTDDSLASRFYDAILAKEKTLVQATVYVN